MSDRLPFDNVLTQLAAAQESINQVPFSAEQRRIRADDIAREEARYQQGRTDALTNTSRTILLQEINQIHEALAALDPNNADDKQAITRLNALLTQRQQALGLEGQAALNAVASGSVTVPGAPITNFGPAATLDVQQPDGASRSLSMTPSATFTPDDVTLPGGQVLAAGTAQARAATERREREVREEQRAHETFTLEMGFDFENASREDQQAFQEFQAEADRLFQKGLTSDQIAAQLFMQNRELHSSETQATLTRKLERYRINSQAGIENRRLDIQQSGTARDTLIESIKGLDPSNPNDLSQIEAILLDAEDAGLIRSDLIAVQSAAKAQTGERARQQFEEGRERIRGITAETASKEAGTSYTQAQELIEKAKDARASASEAMTFVESTTKLGALGVPMLQAMLGALESDSAEGSPFSGFLQHLDPETIEAALTKAREIGEDEGLTRRVAQAEAANAIVAGRAYSIDLIATMYSAEDIQRIMDMSDEDAAKDPVLVEVRKSLRADPGALARAVVLSGYRQTEEELAAAGPKLAFAQAQLQYYSTNRPEDIEVGSDAVRTALQELANVGLLGDPNDVDDQREEIERIVSFYRQGWGDTEAMFNAELAEMASRSALNRANANRALQDATADGGLSLDGLKFQKSVVDSLIDGAKEKATQMGCAVTAQGVRVGDSAMCDTIAAEIAGYQTHYNALLEVSQFRPMSDIEYAATVSSITADVEREMPSASPEEREAEVRRRLVALVTPATEPEPETVPAGPPPTPRERGAAATTGIGGFFVDAAAAEQANREALGEFVQGVLRPGSVGEQLEERWNQPGENTGGR